MRREKGRRSDAVYRTTSEEEEEEEVLHQGVQKSIKKRVQCVPLAMGGVNATPLLAACVATDTATAIRMPPDIL